MPSSTTVPGLSPEGFVWVRPAGPVHQHTVDLSPLEQQVARVYTNGTWFFALGDNEDHLVHWQNIQRGMARLLYQIPHLGGRLAEDDRGFFRIEVPNTEEAGAKLYFSDVRDDPDFPTMQFLAEQGFPVADGERDGLHRLRTPDFPTNSDGDPVLTAQLSRIRGGLILTASHSHLLGDLQAPRVSSGSWCMQTELVASARAAGQPEPELPERFEPELMDRSSISPKVDKALTFSEIQKEVDKLDGVGLLNPEDPESTAEIIRNITYLAHISADRASDEDRLREHVSGIWCFPAENAKSLAKLVTSKSSQRVSNNDTITSFLWQRYYACKYALGEHAAPGETSEQPEYTTIIFPGDIRTRLSPPLPDAFLGAAVDVFSARLRSKSMDVNVKDEDETTQNLADAARAVRETLLKWDESRFRILSRLVQSMPQMTTVLLKGPIDLLFTDHSRTTDAIFADWGPGLGVSLACREPYFGRDIPPGEVVILPRRLNGDLEVVITGERVTLERLGKDQLMRKYSKQLFLSHNVVDAWKERKKSGKGKL